ncbi:MAG: helix-turn-helix transcriptional regulator [Bdellovibrionota bacterium]
MERTGSLSHLRKSLDLPQKVVAVQARICRTHLAQIEAGRLNPTTQEVRRIARALGVPRREVLLCLHRQGGHLWKSRTKN